MIFDKEDHHDMILHEVDIHVLVPYWFLKTQINSLTLTESKDPFVNEYHTCTIMYL